MSVNKMLLFLLHLNTNIYLKPSFFPAIKAQKDIIYILWVLPFDEAEKF